MRFLPIWSHKNAYLCALSVRHRFTFLTARFATVSKGNVHWEALKHRLNTWTLAHFYYVATGTYCGGSNIRGLSLKVNALSRPTPKPTLNLPESVNKCKTDIKTYLLMYACHFNFLICRFELLCRTVITRDSNRSSSPPKYISVLRELPSKLNVYENPYIQGWICVMLTFKIISFQISHNINIVLKS